MTLYNHVHSCTCKCVGQKDFLIRPNSPSSHGYRHLSGSAFCMVHMGPGIPKHATVVWFPLNLGLVLKDIHFAVLCIYTRNSCMTLIGVQEMHG